VSHETRIIFDHFCLDRSNECLWKGPQVIKLRPKAYAVLNQLIARSGQLVTKEELLATVWPETFVGDAVLKVTIRQLRDALDDDPKSPAFIETAHRRGYRFIGRIAQGEQVQASVEEPVISNERQHEVYLPLGLVGRDEALARMRGWLAKMLRGEPQVVFVTGEAGIGKTALVDTFMRYVAFDQSIRTGRGQCLEQYGTSEAYLPILEAIGRLCREQGQIVEVLRAHAPLWLLQMPSLLSSSEREDLNRQVFGATRERMLREIAEALEVLTSDQPLVLILEDIHWSDSSTLDLISYLAKQRRAAHLMLIGTYRPVELIVSGHPLKAVKQELFAKQQCEELPLVYLSKEAIAKYLSVRFPGNRFPAGLAELIYDRTEGNPLFMVNAVEYLLTEKSIVKCEERWELIVGIEKVEVGVPESIKQMIQKQIERLDAADQRTLEVGSLAGAEFSTLAVVAGLEDDRTTVEARCDQLARQRHFIKDCGLQVLPNGETVGRYGFIHALYQNVLYDRLSAARRVQLHRRIGERGEEVYGERAKEISGELAMHFERGRDYQRAAKYLQQTADKAIRRFAYREAVEMAERGLELLAKVPDGPERAERELCLRLTLGVPLVATEGYAAPAVVNLYVKTRKLIQHLGDTPDVSEVLWGLRSSYTLRGDLGMAREIGEEMLRLAQCLPYPGFELRAHWSLESTFTHLGEFVLAMDHFERALSIYDPEQHLDDAFFYALNPGVAMPCLAATCLWFLGQSDQSLKWMQEALARAREFSEPMNLAHALIFAAILHQYRREDEMVEELAAAAAAVSSEHGLVMYQAMATAMRAWAQIKQGRAREAIEQMQSALVALRTIGTELFRPHFLALLAEGLHQAREIEEGLRVLEEAMELANGVPYYQAELYRLKGELLREQSTRQGSVPTTTGSKASTEPSKTLTAEACFKQAISLAQKQQAKSIELRAAVSLARLYRDQEKRREATDLLTQIYNRFTEGFDTVDLREAKALLNEL
jgi:DNA-binding winged helix-turn-helix (wHTH) protein/tetratricopeptide (TPR) repeat protein